MESKVSVFVTGSTGFLGKYFVKDLLKQKSVERVYLLERRPGDYSSKKIKVIVGDLENIEKYEKEILGVDYFFHLAANASFGNGSEYEKINYLPTKKIVSLLKRNKRLKNFIYISTIGAVDRAKNDNCQKPLSIFKSVPSPTSAYGLSKLKSEKYLEKCGVPSTIFRPTWIYGKGMRQKSHINQFINMVYRGSIVSKIAFPGKVSLIYVGDLSRALINCIGNSEVIGKKYFGVTENLSIGKIFNLISTYFKRSSRQLKLINMAALVGFLHSKIPLTVANLFVGYLWAEDKDFLKLLDVKPKTLKSKIPEIVEGNALVNGYWVVTGANSGIGHALVELLRKRKKRLILVDKDINNIQRKEGELVYKCDLSDRKKFFDLVRKISSHRIYTLINNAGIGTRKDFFDMSGDEIERILDVNIRAPLLLAESLFREISSNRGYIVNIGSSAGYNPLPGMSLYAASKSMIINFTEALSVESKGKCSVILVSPSGTATNFQKSAGVLKTTDLLSPMYVAEQIVNSVEKKRQNVALGGIKTKGLIFVSRFLPRSLNGMLQGFLFKNFR